MDASWASGPIRSCAWVQVLLGRPFVSSAISGPGYLRVLYLDPEMRIFESPTDSPDRWEEAGLRVVQIRERNFE